MLHNPHLFTKNLCLILTLTFLFLPAGCGNTDTALQETELPAETEPIEVQINDVPKFSKNTISSAAYTYSPAMQFLDDDALFNSLGTQTFEFDCPVFSSDKSTSQEYVFVKLKLPERWTQDAENLTMFFFPDGTQAMQIQLIPLEEGQCIWSAERLWEDESCINYFEKWINYSWITPYSKDTFVSIHTLEQPNLYDYTYYLPYGSAYFAVHFYTAGENNENALRFQKILLEAIQLLTPIPNPPPVLPSGETWQAAVTCPLEEGSLAFTLNVPVECMQSSPNSARFSSDIAVYNFSIEAYKLPEGQTVWEMRSEDEQLLQRTAVVNGQEIPRYVFTPPYKPGSDLSEEYGPRIYYYYLPVDDICLTFSFRANGVDNQRDIDRHRATMESMIVKNKGTV